MPGKWGVKSDVLGRFTKVLTKKPLTVTEVAKKLNVAPNSLYYHLKTLKGLKGVKTVMLDARGPRKQSALAFAKR